MSTTSLANDSQQQHITKSHGFSVNCSGTTEVIRTYSRKDFYKICLFMGECVVEYADRKIHMEGTNLFFGTPHIPYSWENMHKVESYSCLFTEEFLKTNNNSESLQQSPLFKIGGTPVFKLSDNMAQPIVDIMKKMINAYDSPYIYKDDLARNYINLIIHEALQWEPAQNYSQQSNASARVTSLFMDLLERQFPIESADMPLKLRTPNDFADRLSVHINHLNRSIKENTGKSTTAHIAERMIIEAKALLKHTNWSVAEIAFSLGFEYPTYFNNYFKKHTGATPSTFRG